MSDYGILFLVFAIGSAVLFLGGLWGDDWDRREARARNPRSRR